MKKKILIAILAVIVIVFISGCFIFRDEIGKVRHIIYPINKKYEEKESKDNKESSEIREEGTSTQIVQKSEEKEEIKEDKVENKTSKEETIKTNSNKTSSSSKNTPKNNTPSNSNNNSGGSDSNVTPKQEEKPTVVPKQPWEELGLTEDQYKNQPMYSWEEVDFKTKEECMNYGNAHAEYGFECSEVTSWTRSLGWDYKTF